MLFNCNRYVDYFPITDRRRKSSGTTACFRDFHGFIDDDFMMNVVRIVKLVGHVKLPLVEVTAGILHADIEEDIVGQPGIFSESVEHGVDMALFLVQARHEIDSGGTVRATGIP